MQAVIFEHGRAKIVERPNPVPDEGEALVQVLLAGICGTDVELLKGYYGFSGQPGHEFVGLVKRADSRPDLLGQRVVADINLGCGQCSCCLRGEKRHCPQREVLGIRKRDGAFAEYLSLPAGNLHAVDDSIPDVEAVLAEPLAAALRVTQQLHLTADLHLAVLGDGKLGLLAALSLSCFLPRVTLIGKHESKLSLASRKGLATCRIDPVWSRQDLLELTGRFDVIVEATGQPQGLDLALDLTRPGGTVVLKTTTCVPAELDAARIAVNEIRVLGSRCGDLEQALLFLRKRWFDLSGIISAVYPFRDVSKALEHARSPGTLKVLLRFG